VHRSRILVADDDSGVRFFLTELLKKENYLVDEASDGDEALLKQRNELFDLVILDVKMPKRDGIETLREMRKINPSLIVVMITAYGSQKIALEAIREGAFDYFTKPFDADELLVVIRRALEKQRLLERLNRLQAELTRDLQFDRLLGGSEGMQEVFLLIRKLANTDVTVLICGESGTGKELVAQAIHYHSHRREKPFVKVPCVAIPETLLESELFGHEKGSFTGAYQQKIGKFELAEGGTLFLDEIGDMPASLQAKLLRVLQEREFERVGGTRTVKVNIRIIAATNKDLLAAVNQKTFREDLYFRINVVPIFLPPLRNRRSDIPLLADHFISYYNQKLAKAVTGISDEVKQIFMTYDWPGNVREMENVIQRALILAPSNVLAADSLPIGLRSLSAYQSEKIPADAAFSAVAPHPHGDISERSEGDVGLDASRDFSRPLADQIEDITEQVEKRIISAALRRCNFKRQEAAKLLGISRKSLHNKMKRYRLFEK
jgi:two-component system response regulator AtoC